MAQQVPTIRLIIAGTRNFSDDRLFAQTMQSLTITPDEVVCGMATGADEMGRRWALANNIPVAEFSADWDTHGKKAGPIRNKAMANYGTHLLAFWNGRSRGTGNMIALARSAGLLVRVVLF